MIDDYHQLECSRAVELLCALAGERIPNLHIVLLAREIRLLPEADLLQKGLVCFITQEDLRFQPQEVTAYFTLMDVPISSEDACRIAQWTGGWISGIYLLARGGPTQLRENRSRSIDELLEQNLYRTYPLDTRCFLERLAFLDAFTPDMVAEVFDSPCAPSVLRRLLQGNAFLSYNPEVQGYQMTDLLREFLQLSCLINSDTEFTFGAVSLLYSYYSRPGALLETIQFISQNFHILGQAVENCGSGSGLLMLAEHALETGAFDQVQNHAMKAIYQARMYHQVDIELCAIFALCRLAVFQGNAGQVDDLMSQIAAVVERENSSVLSTTVALCKGYLECCLGRVDQVPDWIRKNAPNYGSFLYAGMGFHHVVTGFAALLKKRHLQLEIYYDSFERNWSIYKNQRGFLFGGIFRAGAQTALHGTESGALALCTALDIAVQDGIILPFAENAGTVLPLLSHPLVQQRYPASYLNRLIDCCRQYLAALDCGSGVHLLLTKREQELLQLLVQGLRRDEIASRLFISVSTVRYHVKNLYRQLGVNNKLAAVAKARELRFLP